MLCQCGILTIALYGFLKNFCPDGFYISDILFGPPKNLTVTEVTQDVFTVLAYSNLFFNLVALLVTDFLQYKTVIIIGAFASASSKVILYYGTTVTHVQIVQLLYGVYRASQVAYRTYIYTQVKKHSYQRVTAVVHITPKLGTLVSAIIAQLLLSTNVVGLQNLILISFVGLSLSFLTAVTLPSVEGTAYSTDKGTLEKPGDKVSGFQRYKRAVNLLWGEFRFASSNINIVKWCVWWILSNGAFQLVSDYYVQALWCDITGEKQNTFNAGVDAIYASVSAAMCYMIGNFKIDWQKHGEAVIAVCTLIKAASLLASAHTSSLLVSYGLYVTTSSLYDIMTIISNSQVASQVKNDSFGLIFGINTFLAMGFQATLTYVLCSKNALALNIRQQFVAVGSFFLVLGFAFLLKTFHTIASSQLCSKLSKKSLPAEVVNANSTKTVPREATLDKTTQTAEMVKVNGVNKVSVEATMGRMTLPAEAVILNGMKTVPVTYEDTTGKITQPVEMVILNCVKTSSHLATSGKANLSAEVVAKSSENAISLGLLYSDDSKTVINIK